MYKKKLLLGGLIVMAMIVGVATFNVSLNVESESLSGMALANTEALAQDEPGGGSDKASCAQKTHNVSAEELCGNGYQTQKRTGVNYLCEKGIAAVCKSGFVGTWYDCFGRGGTSTEQDLSIECTLILLFWSCKQRYFCFDFRTFLYHAL
jgi:hypothetical protein